MKQIINQYKSGNLGKEYFLNDTSEQNKNEIFQLYRIFSI